MMNNIRKKAWIPIFALVLISLLATSCGPPETNYYNPPSTTAVKTSAKPASQPLPYIKGRIDTAPPVPLVKQTVPASGGTVKYHMSGDALDGLTINVPSGAYSTSRELTISSAAVNNVTFPNLKPITPLITVDNGGEFAEQTMLVTIPVKVPAGEFAMGFFYDDQTGKLDGMPTVSQAAGSITVATRHFSKFLVASIGETALDVDILTEFLPGIDDWQFKNKPVAFVNGICAGMSISALWYYSHKPDGPDTHLWGKYDGVGGTKTPGYDEDDALGIKAAGMVQMGYENSRVRYEQFYRDWVNLSPEVTRKLFAFSMLVTGGPQMAEWAVGNEAHAMIAVGVMNRNIILLDPNHPGDVKSTQLQNGQNVYDGKPVAYMATGALIDENIVASRWKQVASGTIGQGFFPPYNAMVSVWDNAKQSFGTPVALTDGMTVTGDTIRVSIQKTQWTSPWSGGNANFSLTFRDPHIITLNGSQRFDNGNQVTLMPGANKIGLLVTGDVTNGRFGDAKNGWSDFRWLTVQSKAPAADSGVLGKLWKTKYFVLAATGGVRSYEVWTPDGMESGKGSSPLAIPRGAEFGWPDIMEISWSGTHFTGRGEYKDGDTAYTGVLTGQISAGGTEIESINFSDTYRSGDSSNWEERKTDLTVMAVPLKDNPELIFTLTGDLLPLAVQYTDVESIYKDGELVMKATYKSTKWSKDAAVKVGFSEKE